MSILRAKVVVVGDATVGKTALVNQLVHQNFINSYQMTQACEYKIKEVPIPDTKSIVELHLIDVAGQKIFNSIAFDLIKDVHMCVLVYDVTQSETFSSLMSWYEGIRDENGKEIPGVLIGNKTDLGRPQVGTEDGAEFARSLGMQFFEVSSMKGQEVEEAFAGLAQQFHEKYEERVKELMQF